MTRLKKIQWNFTNGEVSPLFLGRGDMEKYQNSLGTCLNAIVTKEGSLIKRPGTRFAAKQRNNDEDVRLIPFEYSTTQTYMLEVGSGYIRFYRDSAQMTETLAITAVNTTSEWVKVGENLTDHLGVGDEFTITGSTGNDGTYTVASIIQAATTQITVNEDISDATADGSIVIPTTIANPYTEADLDEIKWTQSADILYLFHPDYEPRELARTSTDDTDADNWVLSEHNPRNGPYLAENTDTAATLTPDATTTSANVTANAAAKALINNGDGFVSTDIGRILSLNNPAAGNEYGWGRITSITSTTICVVTINSDFSRTNATSQWRLGAWSDSTGWPCVGTFHQDRLWVGCTKDGTYAGQPDTVWGSEVGDFDLWRPFTNIIEDFVPAAANAVTFTLRSNQVNAIRWLSSDQQGLAVFTSSSEWILRAAGNKFDPITPSDITAHRQSNYGSHLTVPILETTDVVLFVQAAGLQVHEFTYSLGSDKFVAPDMTLLADHLFRLGIRDAALSEWPRRIAWYVGVNKQLHGFTYERDQEVLGWHQHSIGGTGVSGGLSPDVFACGVIRKDEEDQLWLSVQRQVNSVEARYIEYMAEDFREVANIVDVPQAVYCDSSLEYSGSATNTVTGLDHLEGETVQVLADGTVRTDAVVASGSITFDGDAATRAQVGLDYTLKVETMAPVFHPQLVGHIQRIVIATMRLFESSDKFTYGATAGFHEELVTFDITKEFADELADDTYTGSVKLHPACNFDQFPTFRVESNKPVPLTIQSLILEIEIGGL